MTELEQIIAEYKSGFGHQRLARKYHMCHERLRTMLINAGVYQCEEHLTNMYARRTKAALAGRKRNAGRKHSKPTRAYITPDGERIITDNFHDMATLLTYCDSGSMAHSVIELIRSENGGKTWLNRSEVSASD